MPGLEDLRKKLGKGETESPKQPVSTDTPPRQTRTTTTLKKRFDKQEYTDLLTSVIQYLATYNNPKRRVKLKVGGIVYKRNNRIIKLKAKLEKILGD